MLGVLLTVFLGMRVYADLTSGNVWFTIIDVLLSLSALIFFGAYAHASSSIVKSLTKLLQRTKEN